MYVCVCVFACLCLFVRLCSFSLSICPRSCSVLVLLLSLSLVHAVVWGAASVLYLSFGLFGCVWLRSVLTCFGSFCSIWFALFSTVAFIFICVFVRILDVRFYSLFLFYWVSSVGSACLRFAKQLCNFVCVQVNEVKSIFSFVYECFYGTNH